MLITMYLVRKLSRADYATYSQGDLIIKTMLPFITMGIPMSINFFMPKSKSKEEEKGIILTYLYIIFMLALIGIVFLLTIGKYWINQYDNAYLNDCLLPIIVWMVAEVFVSILPNYYVATQKNAFLLKISVCFSIARIINIFMAYYWGNTVKSIFWALALTSLLKSVFFIIYLLVDYKDVKAIKSSMGFSIIMKYAFIIGLSQLIGKLSDLLDRQMVSGMFTPDEYARFINGAIEIPFLALISSSIGTILLPEFSKNSGNDIQNLKKWKEATEYTSYFIIPIMFVLAVFSKEYICVMYTESYLDSVSIFLIYLLKIPPGIATYSTLLLAKNKNKKIMWNSVYTLIINFILNIVFIKTVGVEGAAIATVISFYILALLQIFQIANVYKVKFSSVFPFVEVGKIFLVCSIVSMLFGGVNLYINMNIILKFLILVPIMYIVCIIALCVSKTANYKLLLNIIRRT